MRAPFFLPLLIACFFSFKAISQGITLKPEKLNSSEIYEDLKKLNFLGSVLYVAAHPDDENTAAISYFANNIKANTTYLSLTRGDGGQNLIGSELGKLLGVIRTHELLAARATDGGNQRFSRANDFGYSKHPDETLNIWDKDKVLADVVWAIRTLKPDVIINRFDHRTPGTTHGHHTSSAMLSVKAFDLAADPKQYPEQLKHTTIWQPNRQFFNTSWWFYGGKEKFEKADKSNLISIDIGEYYTSSGLSNSEISALSRSQHKSQGFGRTGTRGNDLMYLELLRGEKPSSNNIFDGIDTSWNRVPGGKVVQKIIDQIIKEYDFKNPSKSIPNLSKAYTKIQNIENTHWKAIKSKEVKALIAACSGLYLEAVSDTNIATKGDEVSLKIEAINRSDINIKLNKATIVLNNQSIELDKQLKNNVGLKSSLKFTVDEHFKTTSAYWLKKENSLGMYTVDDQSLIGKPENPSLNNILFNLIIAGVPIAIDKPIFYKYNDRVKGEVYSHLEIVEPVSVKLDAKVFIFAKAEAKEIEVTVTANKNNFKGKVFLDHPKGWVVSPNSFDVSIANKSSSKEVVFNVTPPSEENEGYILPKVKTNGRDFGDEMIKIDYDHIPLQTLFLPAKSKVVRLNIKKEGTNIGYIQGAGDAVPENLEQIGYNINVLDINTINSNLLADLDAVVIGIRAYNVLDQILEKQSILLDYTKNGGTLIVQYNTKGRSSETNVGAPYPLTISRDRVTDENSEVRILEKDHSLMNYPNKLSKTDFNGWTQERGLYFPNKWGKEFTPIISMNDKGEDPKDGSILVAKYGKGHYIYTGISFFRELPFGVPGAYKLFANMLSIGKNK